MTLPEVIKLVAMEGSLKVIDAKVKHYIYFTGSRRRYGEFEHLFGNTFDNYEVIEIRSDDNTIIIEVLNRDEIKNTD